MSVEFRVNTYQSNWQRSPDLIAMPDGGFLIVWESYFNNYDDGPVTTYVAGQRYDAFGNPVGGEIVFDAIDGAKSASPRITALSDGGFVIVWEYDDYDAILTLDTQIYAQVFNANGTARSAALRVDTVPSNSAVAPEAIALANGGFVVQFGVDASTTLFDQVYRQQFSATGARVGINQLVNTNVGAFDQIYVRSAALTNGMSITIWNSEGSFVIPGSDLDSNELRGTITRADGTVLRGDFSLADNIGTVGLHPGNGYDVTGLQNGGFVISHLAYDHELGLDTPATPYYMVLRFYDAGGNATSGPIRAFAGADLSNGTRIEQLETGQILLVWSQDPLQAQISDDVYGRMFSSTGTALTGVFEISNDYRDSYAEQGEPEVTALAGGGFVVTYTSDVIDDDNEGIAARIFGRGTAGNDVLTVDLSGTMAGLTGNDTLTGNTVNNGLYGGAGSDVLSGLAGQDTLLGEIGNDSLTGGTGNDLLVGGSGNDVLTGGLGRDVLTGGVGIDTFVFAEAATTANQDVITDYIRADNILLSQAIFGAAGPVGTLAATAFKVLGGGTVDATDRILYDLATGAVYYDPDGSGAAARTVVVVLESRPVITYADFILF